MNSVCIYYLACFFLMRKVFPFPSFISIYQYEFMHSFYSVAYNPLLPLFILAQIWPLRTLPTEFCGFLMSSYHFEYFLTFWYQKIIWAYLHFPYLRPQISLFFFSFLGGMWYLATKNRTLDVHLVTGMALLLGSLSRKS